MPFPTIVTAFERQPVLSLPMAALIMGAVSQVAGLIELTDRVCNLVLDNSAKTTTESETARQGQAENCMGN